MGQLLRLKIQAIIEYELGVEKILKLKGLT